MRIHPHCPINTRIIEVGGLTKLQLIQKLKQNSILMNEYGNRLFADENFTTSDTKYNLKTIELTVMDLGFPNGANTAQLFKRGSEFGLELCPLELGPHLRLKYLDQPEGYSADASQQNKAPSGSITIASEILTKEDDFPKGFYLRRINDVLWLRGYIADELHVFWEPEDRFIFVNAK